MITSNYQNKHPLDNWLRITVFFYAALFLSFSLNAQTVEISTGTPGTPQYNAGPIYRSSSLSAYDAVYSK